MRLSIISSVRTNNFSDEQVLQKMMEVWREASQRLADHEQIKYGVYHDYESNYKGDYRLSVAVENNKQGPFIDIHDNASFEIFKVDTTDEQGIYHTWQKIWDLEKNGVIKRAYKVDYEKYYPDGEIEIYVSIK